MECHKCDKTCEFLASKKNHDIFQCPSCEELFSYSPWIELFRDILGEEEFQRVFDGFIPK